MGFDVTLANFLAEELGISPLEVTKFGGDSRLLQGYLFEEGKDHA